LLLNRNKLLILIFTTLFFFSGCGKKSEQVNKESEIKKFESKEYLLQKEREVLGDDVGFTVKGNFNNKGKLEVVAAKDINNSTASGIQYFLMGVTGADLSITDSTKILEGSLSHSLINKIKFPFFDYELIYYNSKDYYIGSRGGEQFSYIINFKDNEIYYSHIISIPKRKETIFLSKNITRDEIKNFFISIAMKDFPNIVVSSTDIKLDKNNF